MALSLLAGAAFVALLAGSPAEAPVSVSGEVRAGGDPVEGALTLGRLRYGGGGDWYANPTSLPNLARAVARDTGLPVAVEPRVVTPLDPGLLELHFVHMTGHGNVAFSEAEREALRQWLDGGGFLHADDNYGMDTAFRREMAALFPDDPLVPLPPDHPVFEVVHPFPEGLPKIHEHDGEPPGAWGIFRNGRLVVFYSHETDLGNGWEDPEVHDLPADLREAALRMGVNLVVYALARRLP